MSLLTYLLLRGPLDIATFGVAFGALVVMRMPDVSQAAAAAPAPRPASAPEPMSVPEPELAPGPAAAGPVAEPSTLGDNRRYGWRFIRAGRGLLPLLTTFGVLSFLVNIAVASATPLVLSFADPATFGVAAACGGVAVGGLLVIWKGPTRRIPLMLTALAGCGIFIALYGVRPSPALVAVGQLGFFCLPVANALGAGTGQRRVPAAAQGRVFAVRHMLAQVSVPIAILVAGLLIDHVFEPLMTRHGRLVGSLDYLLGVGPEPGRVIGLLFVLLGLAMVIATLAGAARPALRAVERAEPAVPPAVAPAAVPGGS